MIKKIFYCGFFIVSAVMFMQTPVLAEPANLGLLKNQLVSYCNTGEYLKELTQVATQASDYIQQQVDSNQHQPQPKQLAIVLDIDETSLSNYSNMIQDDFANNPPKILEELLAGNEPAIQPILDLYQQAIQNNVAVFFVTGRDESLRTATIQNLKVAGYTQWAGLELRTGHIPTIVYKTAARAKITQQGYTILASIGDQESDLIGGYAQRTFKLPNPFYYLP